MLRKVPFSWTYNGMEMHITCEHFENAASRNNVILTLYIKPQSRVLTALVRNKILLLALLLAPPLLLLCCNRNEDNWIVLGIHDVNLTVSSSGGSSLLFILLLNTCRLFYITSTCLVMSQGATKIMLMKSLRELLVMS